MTYVVLVGLPLMGVLAVLHAGRSLVAPPSLGGAWALTADPRSVPDEGAPALAVSQSGTLLALDWPAGDGPAVRYAGRLVGDSILAAPASDGGARKVGPCAAAGTHLRLRVLRGESPQRMRGAITHDDAGCPAVAVEAVRVAPREGDR